MACGRFRVPDTFIRKVVILGGGTAGWMTAAALSKVNSPHQFDIALVESEDIGTVGVGEATIPTIHWFNKLVGLDESAFLRDTRASFKLGIQFKGWTGDGSAYFHPFGRYGDPQDGAMFYHRWIRAWLNDPALDYQKLSLATALAQAHRFSPPAGDPRALAASLGYAYHFDASLYAQHLRRLSEGRGVARTEGRVADIRRDAETGFITSLTTDRGDVVEGDLFIDCSGLRALLIEDTLKTGFDDWSHWLPCDRALAVPCANGDDIAPFTQSIAHGFGWQWRIPLQHRTGNGIVYSSAFATDDEAEAALMANLPGQAQATPRQIRFKAGRRRQAWAGNVVAIGLSSGFLEPLESTSIHLIQSGIAKLLSLFPTRACDEVTARQFNKVFDAEMDAVRDFLILHYRHSHGRDEAMWRHCQAMDVPDSLRFKEDSFRRTGRIVLDTDELFREASWFAVMMGQGVHPTGFNPLVQSFSEADDLRHFQSLQDKIAAFATAAPTHLDALKKRGAFAPVPA